MKTCSCVPDNCEVAALNENSSESLYTDTNSSSPGILNRTSNIEEELLACIAIAEKTVAFWGWSENISEVTNKQTCSLLIPKIIIIIIQCHPSDVMSLAFSSMHFHGAVILDFLVQILMSSIHMYHYFPVKHLPSILLSVHESTWICGSLYV